MNKIRGNMEDIVYGSAWGFHQYILSDPAHLGYVSPSLCQILGVEEKQLLHETRDLYAALVQLSDREKYEEWIACMAQGEKTGTCEYCLRKKDGERIWVKDTLTVRRLEDGTLVGDSILADITDVKAENQNLKFLNETIPCGFLKYTCEKQPRITFINGKMIEILRFPQDREGELDYLELYKSNIFLMIPMEERRRFQKYLDCVYSAGMPLAGELNLLRCDGTRACVFGWVTKGINEEGVEEFQSVCMDVTERHREKREKEIQQYIKALTEVYDKIFQCDIRLNTIKCLHNDDSSTFKHFENVGMQMDDALEKWIMSFAVPQDQDRLRQFFQDFCRKSLDQTEGKPLQITYHARSSKGKVKKYRGVFIQMSGTISFFCCRCVQDLEESTTLRNENVQLKEKMKELVLRFTDGIAAFELTAEGLVRPLYASENVCEFFGYTREEWLPLMEKSTPWESFVSYSEASYEDYAELLRNGEAEFTYFDYKTEEKRKIRAICSQKEPGGSAPRYIMLYSMEDTRREERKRLTESRTVSIRTFGYFDVFVGERPIAFRNKKSKELFALLVDRRGGYVTSEEAISFLWEEEPVNPVTLARYRKVALRLKNTLEEYGIADVMETVDGKRRIVAERVQCDLYDYLSGREEHRQLFKGSYLSNYSWGENTLAELSGEISY